MLQKVFVGTMIASKLAALSQSFVEGQLKGPQATRSADNSGTASVSESKHPEVGLIRYLKDACEAPTVWVLGKEEFKWRLQITANEGDASSCNHPCEVTDI